MKELHLDLESYIETKTLLASPLNLGDYNVLRGWEIPDNEDPKREGYFVQYPDGYNSWSPKEVFEESYRSTKGLIPIEYGIVFPSEENTVSVVPDVDYNGAHRYCFQNSLGFKDGKAEYIPSLQFIQFVQKNEDGTMIPGVQSEQLILAILDRTKKLNAKFPSPENLTMIYGLEMFLEACEKRIRDRMARGVMGGLKK